MFPPTTKADAKNGCLRGASLKTLLASVAMLIVGLIMIFTAWRLTQSAHRASPTLTPTPAPDFALRRKAFFQKEIAPLIADEDARNRAAIRRAEARVNEVFAGYRGHVPEFADALTQWGTKFQITKAMVKDKLNRTDETGKIPIQLFAEKVVSDQKLIVDITKIVETLKTDCIKVCPFWKQKAQL